MKNNAKGLEAGLNPHKKDYNYISCKKYLILVIRSIHECNMKGKSLFYLRAKVSLLFQCFTVHFSIQ